MICGLGVMEIHSATDAHQVCRFAYQAALLDWGGVGACSLVSLINYQALLDRIHWIYIAAVASLMRVMIFGQKYLGARRWIKMPGGAALSALGVGEADPDPGGGQVLSPICISGNFPGRTS
jgi:cell division protein FtsW (lipid II flippase)